MSDVSKILLPNNSVVNIKDSRIPGIDSAPTSGSGNLITSGGVYDAIPDNVWKWGSGQGRCIVVNSSKAGTTAGYDSLSEGYLCDTGGSATSNTKTPNASNVLGSCSHAEGNATIAKGLSCHSEGKKTFASGEGSHAEGIETTSTGKASHAEGEGTSTNNYGEHAGGRYNLSTKTSSTYGNAGNTSLSHGIGTADNARKNALEIMENGDMYLYGVGSYTGANYSASTTVQSILNNIPNTSNFVQKSGGTMSSGATIIVPNTSAGSTTTVAPGYVYIDKGDFTIQIDATTLTPRVTVQDDDSSTLVRLQPTELIYGDGTDTYTLSFPSKSGTFAMTSDVPSAVTESTVSGWGFTKNTGTYSKPSGGIPASDIASGVIPTVPPNVSAFTNDANYVKYALCADEAAYSAIANKDSGTLYLIPEEE